MPNFSILKNFCKSSHKNYYSSTLMVFKNTCKYLRNNETRIKCKELQRDHNKPY